MSHRIPLAPLLGALLVVAAGAVPTPAAEPEKPEAGNLPGYERVYRTQFLRGQDGPLIAYQACLALPSTPSRPCTYRIEGGNWFIFRSDDAGHKAIAEALAREDAAPPTQTYRVTLLRATPAAAPAPHLPAGEMRALEGAKQVLPFRGYTLIDGGFLRSSERGALTLAGDEPGSSLSVAMALRREATSSTKAMNVSEFVVKRQQHSSGKETQLLHTAFWINAGETVVVGTSRLNGGDEALVVLLTAGE